MVDGIVCMSLIDTFTSLFPKVKVVKWAKKKQASSIRIVTPDFPEDVIFSALPDGRWRLESVSMFGQFSRPVTEKMECIKFDK